ncbi:hypothetical protein K437DRAFT_66009 [Tilletiaria anomala UBC 951]|uniref:PHD-type domain-containing protein n=1 Tax=Tilletiaria anomala (strain ATCC 24038 / CBS 436.72 / UBC 951) TaxID=1037660 RepID=A0A066WH71_TILAU|nr:uncharacterized protein K437DRAFT_66009 [Tilletiaria anomala UBC 951]KDN50389.1 hypothetical protein K437DRAFT_66009 [Tilletiaria anomala UBC 951]
MGSKSCQDDSSPLTEPRSSPIKAAVPLSPDAVHEVTAGVPGAKAGAAPSGDQDQCQADEDRALDYCQADQVTKMEKEGAAKSKKPTAPDLVHVYEGLEGPGSSNSDRDETGNRCRSRATQEPGTLLLPLLSQDVVPTAEAEATKRDLAELGDAVSDDSLTDLEELIGSGTDGGDESGIESEKTSSNESWDLGCECCGAFIRNADLTDDVALICCSVCETWQHIRCWDRHLNKNGLPPRDWDAEGEDFFCTRCKTPNHSIPLPAYAIDIKVKAEQRGSLRTSEKKQAKRPKARGPDAEEPVWKKIKVSRMENGRIVTKHQEQKSEAKPPTKGKDEDVHLSPSTSSSSQHKGKSQKMYRLKGAKHPVLLDENSSQAKTKLGSEKDGTGGGQKARRTIKLMRRQHAQKSSDDEQKGERPSMPALEPAKTPTSTHLTPGSQASGSAAAAAVKSVKSFLSPLQKQPSDARPAITASKLGPVPSTSRKAPAQNISDVKAAEAAGAARIKAATNANNAARLQAAKAGSAGPRASSGSSSASRLLSSLLGGPSSSKPTSGASTPSSSRQQEKDKPKAVQDAGQKKQPFQHRGHKGHYKQSDSIGAQGAKGETMTEEEMARRREASMRKWENYKVLSYTCVRPWEQTKTAFLQLSMRRTGI